MNIQASESRLNIIDTFKLYKYKKEYNKQHPYEFKNTGITIFASLPDQRQGSGKTLSGVDYVHNLLNIYPFCILVSNIKFHDYPFNAYYEVVDGVTFIRDIVTNEIITIDDIISGKFKKVCIKFDGLDCLKAVKNGEFGVIFFIDEIQLYMNSLDSKNIPMEVMTEISQQRKQRVAIIGTSQLFLRVAKQLREQVSDLVICKNYFKCFQFNLVCNPANISEKDGRTVAQVDRRYFFFHSPEMYNRYDTYVKIESLVSEWNGVSRDSVSFISVL